MTWRLIERRGRIEVRIYSGKQTPALYYEVTVTPGEIESNPTGVEAYGFDREVYQEFAESVIIPAIEGKLWDWDCVLSVLEKYLGQPDKYAALLVLTVERIHLADRITRIDARFGRLVVQFVSLLPRISFGFDKMLVADWCYNLVNALFLWAKDIAGIECWVRQHRDIIGKAFTDGLPILADLQPRIADYCALLLHQANELQEP